MNSKLSGGVKIHQKQTEKQSKFIYFDRNEHLTIGEYDNQLKYTKTEFLEKTSIHWGQLKLFATELEFINLYWNPEQIPNPIIVYVGAARGTHIQILSELYPQFKFHLYDEPRFDPILKSNPNITIYEKYFEDEDVDRWKNKNNVFFISDIRNLNYNNRAGENEHEQRQNENYIKDDMLLQQSWVKKIKPVKALLKFRLPLPYEWNPDLEFHYLNGLLFLQPFAPPNSNELRLVPNDDYESFAWNIETYSSLLFSHRKIMRQMTNFKNLFTDDNTPIDLTLGLTNDYDSAAFCQIVSEYLMKHMIDPKYDLVISLIKIIFEKIKSENFLFNLRNGEKDYDF